MNEYENKNTNTAPETETQSTEQNNTYYYTASAENTDCAYGGASSERPVKPKTDGFGIASFCVALSFVFIGCCCCCCIPELLLPLVVFSFVAEIAALVFAIVSRKIRGNFSGLAMAGLIISIIMIVLYLVIVISVFGVLLAFPDLLEDLVVIVQEEGAYVEFFEKYAPDFYSENKEMLDEFFREYFAELEQTPDL